MEMIFREIELANQSGLHYLAIALSLTVPDICCALESPNGEGGANRYKAWYLANLASKYPNITDTDIWSLRCGVLHQGRYGNQKLQYARILFTLPAKNFNFTHNNIVFDALNLDAVRFCNDIIASGRAWFTSHQNDPFVVANLPRLVQLRPNGIAPYMQGGPVIS